MRFCSPLRAIYGWKMFNSPAFGRSILSLLINMTICLSHKLYSMTTVAIFKYCVGCLCSVVSALELKDHLYKQAKNLSAGLKRKVSHKYNSVQKIENHTLSCTLGLFFLYFSCQLCFALSMLGNPQIVLLDEPSTGMDPKSKQRMW